MLALVKTRNQLISKIFTGKSIVSGAAVVGGAPCSPPSFACSLPVLLSRFLAEARRFWYGKRMDTNPFDLTPEQKDLLVALAQETGKPVPALIADALDALQAHVHATQVQHPGHGGHGNHTSPLPASPPKKKHIWEVAAELVAEIPEEDLARLPVDGAAQHDHYIYGTPKRTL